MIYHRGAAQNGYGTIRQDPSAARQEPRLAEKLRREYRGRGEDLRGVGAASTEELMRRAAMGRDPRVNVSEEAFEQRLHNRGQSFTYPQNARPRTQYTNYQRSNPQRRNTDGYTARNPGQRAGEGAGIRSRRNPEPKSRTESAIPKETRVARRSLPPFFVLLLTFMTVMVLLIVFSIAQIYKTTDEIGDLKSQLSTLQTTAAELELKIEEKNDIRTIEKIATEELGMVKEDSVQKKYVSLSDGEHIDLIEEPEQDTTSDGLGTMLSSIVSALGRWFGGDSTGES